MRQNRAFLLPLLLLCFSAAALAGPFTAVVVYGDSLSDNGNLYAATGRPPSPYYNGRFSNGPVAVEDLANALGVPLVDFAWGGATTGLGNYGDNGTPTSLGAFNLPGMGAMFSATTSTIAPMAASSLFVVWGGPDDFLAPSPLDGGDPLKTADRAVANIIAIVNGLKGLGAHNILVPGMPDLGLTPYFISIGKGAAGSGLTDYFNAKLRASLPAGVTFYDTAALMRDMFAHPAAYGLTNVTDACVTTGCATPNSYLFWDDFHPGAHVDQIAANGFAAAVPEPSTMLLTFPAIALGLFARRMMRAR